MLLAFISGYPSSTEIVWKFLLTVGVLIWQNMAEQPTCSRNTDKGLSSAHTVCLPFELGKAACMTQTIPTVLQPCPKQVVKGFGLLESKLCSWGTTYFWDKLEASGTEADSGVNSVVSDQAVSLLVLWVYTPVCLKSFHLGCTSRYSCLCMLINWGWFHSWEPMFTFLVKSKLSSWASMKKSDLCQVKTIYRYHWWICGYL